MLKFDTQNDVRYKELDCCGKDGGVVRVDLKTDQIIEKHSYLCGDALARMMGGENEFIKTINRQRIIIYKIPTP